MKVKAVSKFAELHLKSILSPQCPWGIARSIYGVRKSITRPCFECWWHPRQKNPVDSCGTWKNVKKLGATCLFDPSLVLQIPSEKVFTSQKTSPNTVSEGVWSCRAAWVIFWLFFNSSYTQNLGRIMADQEDVVRIGHPFNSMWFKWKQKGFFWAHEKAPYSIASCFAIRSTLTGALLRPSTFYALKKIIEALHSLAMAWQAKKHTKRR